MISSADFLHQYKAILYKAEEALKSNRNLLVSKLMLAEQLIEG